MAKKTVTSTAKSFAPVVTVIGHVDHGKTTLLDAIRKTDIAGKEHGGITQGIGASCVDIIQDKATRGITFIDTPGHETFSQMRSRGAKVADIGLLVVSVVDGVQPQTKEGIKLLQEAKIPFIVVLTKTDLPEKNSAKTKQQLVKEGVILEGLGGDVPTIEVSAKTGKNIKELLDLILLVFDMQVSDGKRENEFRGVVIESRLDQKSGPRATVVVRNGVVLLRDIVVCEKVEGRVRTLINGKGQHVNKAETGDAVEMLGFVNVPVVGGIVSKKSEAKKIFLDDVSPSVSTTYSPHAKENSLSIILCTDTQGSLEAIIHSLSKEVNIVSQKSGEVSESDVFFAKSTNAIILGFNVRMRGEIVKLAATEMVAMKNYTIIYELITEIRDVLEGKRLALVEKIFGTAKVLASFPFEKTFVLGISVLKGRIAKGDRVRLMRQEVVIGESSISSIRQGKDPVSKIEEREEGGIILSPSLDFTIGDMLLSHA